MATKPNQRLQQLRQAKSLTRQQVARALDISERTVLRHELGYTPLSHMHLRAYADYYGVPLEDLNGEAVAA